MIWAYQHSTLVEHWFGALSMEVPDLKDYHIQILMLTLMMMLLLLLLQEVQILILMIREEQPTMMEVLLLA